MTKNRAWALGALLLATAIGAGAQEKPSSFAPANARATRIDIVSQPANYEMPSSHGSVELNAAATCSRTRPNKIDVALNWNLPGAVAGELRVDVTGFNDGFVTGRYLTSGVRPGAQRALTFFDAEAGVYYYWRLVIRTGEGWVVAANDRFEAPTCPADPPTE